MGLVSGIRSEVVVGVVEHYAARTRLSKFEYCSQDRNLSALLCSLVLYHVYSAWGEVGSLRDSLYMHLSLSYYGGV